TGTIAFTLTAPDGSTSTVGTVAVKGDGTYSSPTVLATQVGTYIWQASYSGDGLNNGAVDNGTNESVTTIKASPAISTIASVGGVAGDVTLRDTAYLTGVSGPTGTITFTLTAPDGSVVDTENVAVNGDGTYSTPTGYLPTATFNSPDTYTWHATYNGDPLNNTAADNGANETAIVIQAKYTPTLVTTASVSANGVVGSAIPQDSATLSGGFLVDEGAASIPFTLTAPDGSVVDSETVPVTGDGTYNTANTVVATQVGTYTWSASYSGNDYNNGASDQGGPTEQVTTIMASPSLVTQASFASGFIPSGKLSTVIPASAVGTALPQDTAVLSGGYHDTGTITFTLTAPDGTVVDTETVPVTGNGTYTTANVNVATQVGTYTWVATYSGDNSLNNAASDQGGTAEQLTTIKASPTISTVASETNSWVGSALLSDTAYLSGGSLETGTITFTLKAPDGSIAAVETVTVTPGITTYSSPTPVLATQAGTYTWLATYSGDVNNNVAIDNGVNESSSVHVYLQISGFKFYDANGDGQWEPGEVKLSGWTIQLYENINGVLTLVGSQVTDVNGNYSFTNLWAGTYYIKEVLQPGWTQTVGNEIITTSGNVVD